MNSAVTEAAVTSPRRRVLVPLLLFVVAAIFYGVDQLTKNWVERSLTEGQTVEVFGDFLQWHFVRNPGAAFSMASGQTWIFTILASVVVVVILWQLRRLRSALWALFLGMLLGGVLGNLTDRLIREPGFPVGHVVDFISTPWMMPAIYNVADIGIVGGMIIFVVLTLFGVRIEGGRHPRKEPAEADTAAAAEEAPVTTDGPDEGANMADLAVMEPDETERADTRHDEEQGRSSGTP